MSDFLRRTDPPPCSLPVNLDDIPSRVHGSRLGREHRSLRMHLVEDHGCDPGWAENASDGTAHGRHDRRHRRGSAWAEDLPHGDRATPEGGS